MSKLAALDKQREANSLKQEALNHKKLLAAQREYANTLTYVDIYHSQACWKFFSGTRPMQETNQ